MSVRADNATDALIETTGPSIDDSDEVETSEMYEDLETVDLEEELDFEENAPDSEQASKLSEAAGRVHEMGQMGAKRIGSLAIGIGIVGIVLNKMVSIGVVANSSGVINVTQIFNTAGQGLQLLVIGVIIAAAAVLLSLWSGF